MFAFRRRLVIGGCMALVLGCTNADSVTSPHLVRDQGVRSDLLETTTTLLGSTTESVEGTILARLSGLALELSTSAVIGSEGGVLEIPSAGVRVVIPAGALSSATTITLTAPAGTLVLYTFAPHGLQFAQPIRIEQQLAGTAAQESASLAGSLFGGYLPNGLLDVVGTVGTFTETFTVTLSHEVAGTVASFETTHFSGYALASGRSGAEE